MFIYLLFSVIITLLSQFGFYLSYSRYAEMLGKFLKINGIKLLKAKKNKYSAVSYLQVL